MGLNSMSHDLIDICDGDSFEEDELIKQKLFSEHPNIIET